MNQLIIWLLSTQCTHHRKHITFEYDVDFGAFELIYFIFHCVRLFTETLKSNIDEYMRMKMGLLVFESQEKGVSGFELFYEPIQQWENTNSHFMRLLLEPDGIEDHVMRTPVDSAEMKCERTKLSTTFSLRIRYIKTKDFFVIENYWLTVKQNVC